MNTNKLLSSSAFVSPTYYIKLQRSFQCCQKRKSFSSSSQERKEGDQKCLLKKIFMIQKITCEASIDLFNKLLFLYKDIYK